MISWFVTMALIMVASGTVWYGVTKVTELALSLMGIAVMSILLLGVVIPAGQVTERLLIVAAGIVGTLIAYVRSDDQTLLNRLRFPELSGDDPEEKRLESILKDRRVDVNSASALLCSTQVEVNRHSALPMHRNALEEAKIVHAQAERVFRLASDARDKAFKDLLDHRVINQVPAIKARRRAEKLAVRAEKREAKRLAREEESARRSREKEEHEAVVKSWKKYSVTGIVSNSYDLERKVKAEANVHKQFWSELYAYLDTLVGESMFRNEKHDLERLLEWRDSLVKKLAEIPEVSQEVNGIMFSIDLAGARVQHERRLKAVNELITTITTVLEQLPHFISAINLEVPVGITWAEQERDELYGKLGALLDNIELVIGHSPRRAKNASLANTEEKRRMLSTGEYEAALELNELQQLLGHAVEPDQDVLDFEAGRPARAEEARAGLTSARAKRRT